MDFNTYFNFDVTREIFQRGLAFLYLNGFLIAYNQFIALSGSNGLVPAKTFINRSSFERSPSLFFFNYQDWFFRFIAAAGVLLSLFALSGYSEQFGLIPSVLTWALLWFFYLSFVNVGQPFYGFGWEIMICETGFLAIFLGSNDVQASAIIILLIKWVLFRNMFGAGLIKLRGDACWKDLTALKYHFETQPLPNPFSRWFHFLPKKILRGGVWFNHYVELIVPFFIFVPGRIGYLAAVFIILFQSVLIASGNLSWLNYLTVLLCVACFDDSFFGNNQLYLESNYYFSLMIILVFILICSLSIKPIRNLFSKTQSMNASFDPCLLVNTYGAFGSITRVRNEIIIEGSYDNQTWHSYEFKGKPGKLDRRPPIVSPYHYKLDWQMWFAAMSPSNYSPWFEVLVGKLLIGDKNILKLLDKNNYFNQNREPPKYVRAKLYRYNFENRNKKNYWSREFVGDYYRSDSPRLDHGWHRYR